jgi:hypothetical protein
MLKRRPEVFEWTRSLERQQQFLAGAERLPHGGSEAIAPADWWAGAQQRVVKVGLHQTGDASRSASLLP